MREDQPLDGSQVPFDGQSADLASEPNRFEPPSERPDFEVPNWVIGDGDPQTDIYVPRRAAQPKTNKAWLIVLILAFTMSIGGLVWYFWANREVGVDSTAPVWSPGMPAPTTAPTAPLPTPESGVPAWCVTQGEPFVPTHFEVPNHDKNLNILSLGLDANGAAAAPPGSQGYTLAWYNKGPLANADKGMTLLSGHTFTTNGAIGNELNNGLLQVGDYIELSDDQGNSACYQYANTIRVFVNEYDPDSKLVYDNDGYPRMVLVVCSDWDTVGKLHTARALYYFYPVKDGEVAVGDPNADPAAAEPEGDGADDGSGEVNVLPGG
jgi:hypothetical protein